MAQNHLGYAYAHALGVAKNYVKAVAWWAVVSVQGIARGHKANEVLIKRM